MLDDRFTKEDVFKAIRDHGPLSIFSIAEKFKCHFSDLRDYLFRLERDAMIYAHKQNFKDTLWSVNPAPADNDHECGISPETHLENFFLANSELDNKTVDLELQLEEMGLLNTFDEATKSDKEASHFFARFEDMCRAFPHVYRWYSEACHEIARLKLENALLKKEVPHESQASAMAK